MSASRSTASESMDIKASVTVACDNLQATEPRRLRRTYRQMDRSERVTGDRPEPAIRRQRACPHNALVDFLDLRPEGPVVRSGDFAQ